MTKIGVALAVVGALVVLEALGVSVMGQIVDALGGVVEDLAGTAFWGSLDFLNPFNYV